MVAGKLAYFFVREVPFTLHQQATQHDPAFLALFCLAFDQDFVQRGAAGVFLSTRYANFTAARRHARAHLCFTCYGSKEQKTKSHVQ